MEERSFDIAMKSYLNLYKANENHIWQGRNDGESPEDQRWHQRIKTIDLSKEELPVLLPNQKGVAIVGFACDEGVKRNKGRTGAKDGPIEIRQACANFPVHFDSELKFIDAGDVFCNSSELEESQTALSILLTELLKAGYTPLLLGGGHEITFPHYLGTSRFIQSKSEEKNIGIINFDAHFDLRKSDLTGATSGTGFYQIANLCKENQCEFHYLPMGIQKKSNTVSLFETARHLNVTVISDEECDFSSHKFWDKHLVPFLEKVDHIQLTIDLDVFQTAFAPGVSATNASGIIPDLAFYQFLRKLLDEGKVLSLDISELNPTYDIDHRTAKLAASIAFEFLQSL
jgi:formiminoglutamase